MKQVRVAIVGAGDWGKNLTRNFNKVSKIVAICDLNPQAAAAVAAEYNAAVFTWEQILTSQYIDAIVIASNRSHYPLARAALSAGKHIFVEKPLTYNVKQAEELYLLARSMQKKIMVGHLLNYHPAFIKIKQICSTNLLGDLHYVYSNRLAFGKCMPEEDVILNFASHDISILLSLAGKPTSLTVLGDNFLIKGFVDQAVLHFNFATKLKGHVFVSWFHPFKERKFIIIGSKGTIVWDDLLDWPNKLCLYRHEVALSPDLAVLKNINSEFIPIENPIEPLLNEAKHFITCLELDQTPQTDGLEAIEVLKVIEQAVIQIKN